MVYFARMKPFILFGSSIIIIFILMARQAVSKLRKKLTGDSSVKFINVPGRVYKFIIE